MKTASASVGTIFRPPHLAYERRSRSGWGLGIPLIVALIAHACVIESASAQTGNANPRDGCASQICKVKGLRLITDGTAAAPSFTWIADPDTGFFRSAANEIGFTTGGTLRATIGSSGFVTSVVKAADGAVGAPAYSFNADADTGIWRPAADTLDIVTNGQTRAKFFNTETSFFVGATEALRLNGSSQIDVRSSPIISTTADEITFLDRLKTPDGTAANTAIGPSSDLDTGINWGNPGVIAFVSGGADKAYFNASSQFDLRVSLIDGNDGAIPIVMGTAGGPSNIGGTACVNTTAVGNLGASAPDDLQSCTVAANSLVLTGRCLDVEAVGTTTGNANAKTVRLVVGATALVTKQLTASVEGTWKIKSRVCRTGASAQDAYSEAYNNNGSTVASADGATVVKQAAWASTTETETAAITFKTQSTVSTTDNDVISQMITVRYE